MGCVTETFRGSSFAGKDLRALNKDGSTFDCVDFTGANLTGANFSESRFTNCIFNESCLIDVCFCESIFENCSFDNARFAATDICYAQMRNCSFSGLSALSLGFVQLSRMENCTFTHDGRIIAFDKAPIVIQGLLNTPCALMGDDIILGQKLFKSGTLWPMLGRLFLDTQHKKHA